MNEIRQNRKWGIGDVCAVVAFGAAVLVGVSVVMSWIEPNPAAEGHARVVLGLAGFLGELPLLGLCGASVWLATRYFLVGRPAGLGRLVTTAILAAGGLALLLGAAWPPHGGDLGGTAVGLFGALLTAVLGLALVAVPLWHLCLRPQTAPEGVISDEEPPPADRDPESHGGLSAAEADALLPKPPRAWPRPPSPYPADVRLEGRIPEGARPIQTTSHAPPVAAQATDPADHPPHEVPGWVPGAWQAEQRAGADLAAEPGDEPAGAEAPSAATLAARAAEEIELAAWRVPAASSAAPEIEEEEDEADETLEAELETLASTEVAEAPPTPTWEQPELFAEEEPVDAYGTPLELVESLRSGSTDEPPPEEEDEGDEEDEEDEQEPEPIAHVERAEVDELPVAEPLEEDDTDEDEEAETEVELVPHRALALEPELEEEDDEDEEEDEVESERAPASTPLDELVFKAGALILDRGRVAVSLLQREFKLDFDQATELLDRLQQAGLIGPYVGGQRRDILLSPEEWSEKQVGAS